MKLRTTLPILCLLALPAHADPEVKVVRTWGELLDQPATKITTKLGDATVRVGVEAKAVDFDGSVLIYALVEGEALTAQVENCLGPLEVKRVSRDGKELESSKGGRLDELPPDGAHRALYVRTVHGNERGKNRWNLRFEERLLGRVAVVVGSTPHRHHPFFVLQDPTARQLEQRMLKPNEPRRVANTAHRAVPKWSGSDAAVWELAGKPIPRTRRLPGIVPEKPGSLKVKVEGKLLVVEGGLNDDQPAQSLLARWWVNGKPFLGPRLLQRLKEPFREMASRESSGPLPLKVELDRKLLLAEPNDRIEVQFLYCPNGWYSPVFHEPGKERNVQRLMEQTLPVLSNRVRVP